MREASERHFPTPSGNATADDLLPDVYAALRRMASQRMTREVIGHTLQPTALVHEAYLRLVNSRVQKWDGPGHFYAAAAEAMRRILIESARRRKQLRRGGDLTRVPFSEARNQARDDTEQLLRLDLAISRLEKEDPRKATIVKLRYFGGLTAQEIATLLEVSASTVNHEWAYARAWLARQVDSQADLGI